MNAPEGEELREDAWDPSDDDDGSQAFCITEDCYSTGPFRHGYCRHCYHKATYEGTGERADIPPENRVEEGWYVLVSQAHPDADVRGLYGHVVGVEDDGGIAVVEFDGEDVLNPRAAEFKGKRMRILALWLLTVSCGDEDEE